jgi:exosortase D (VPLPA-CTERM-specific)
MNTRPTAAIYKPSDSGPSYDLRRRSLTLPLILVLACGLVALITCWDGLADLHRRWLHEEEYGYGYLALAFVAFYLWRRLPNIRALPQSSGWLGVWIVLFSQIAAVLGALGESYFIEQVALVSTLFGLAVIGFGVAAIPLLLPAVVILLLTIPLPYTLQAILTVKLQLVSTQIGVAVIRLLGISVFVDGNIIDLGSYKLQVVEACSGLRYLLPLTCIASIVACLYRAPLWKRSLLIFAAMPVTVLINSVRIAAIAVLVDNYGPQMAEGFLHQFEGWVVFLFGLALLLIFVLVLERFRFPGLELDVVVSAPKATPVRSHASGLTAAVAALVTVVAAFAVVVSIDWAQARTPKPVRETFQSFPAQLAGWTGREETIDPVVLNVLKATDTYAADFSASDSKLPVNLFVAYYDSLARGAAIHSPRVCLPGSGWEFVSFEERPFTQLKPTVAGSYNRVVIQKGQEKVLMYYWFQQRERRTANEFKMKYFLLLDSLQTSRKDGALVRVYTPINGAEHDADAKLQKFVASALPELDLRLPR